MTISIVVAKNRRTKHLFITCTGKYLNLLYEPKCIRQLHYIAKQNSIANKRLRMFSHLLLSLISSDTGTTVIGSQKCAQAVLVLIYYRYIHKKMAYAHLKRQKVQTTGCKWQRGQIRSPSSPLAQMSCIFAVLHSRHVPVIREGSCPPGIPRKRHERPNAQTISCPLKIKGPSC